MPRRVKNYERLKAAAPLLVEETPRLYVYQLRMGASFPDRSGWLLFRRRLRPRCHSRHEHTRRDKEDDRTRHLLDLRAQTGPVFLTYRARPVIDGLTERIMTGEPLYNFTAVDGVQHTMWIVEPAEEHQLVVAFDAVPALYIADGHHRAASAARARKQLAGEAGKRGEWDTFLAVAFPDGQVQILPYNRVVLDLAGMTPGAFMDTLRKRFIVTDGPASPARKGGRGDVPGRSLAHHRPG